MGSSGLSTLSFAFQDALTGLDSEQLGLKLALQYGLQLQAMAQSTLPQHQLRTATLSCLNIFLIQHYDFLSRREIRPR